MGRTCSQNEQQQVGQDNIRMDTHRRKTSKMKVQKERERQPLRDLISVSG